VVTIGTTTFNAKKLYVLLKQCIYVFCIHLRKKEIISVFNINWLVFITQMESVYCAVRTGSLYIIRVNLSLGSAHTVYLCVLYRSQNKQRLFPYTALTGWFL
jgi:hypothetical protein